MELLLQLYQCESTAEHHGHSMVVLNWEDRPLPTAVPAKAFETTEHWHGTSRYIIPDFLKVNGFNHLCCREISGVFPVCQSQLQTQQVLPLPHQHWQQGFMAQGCQPACTLQPTSAQLHTAALLPTAARLPSAGAHVPSAGAHVPPVGAQVPPAGFEDLSQMCPLK